MKNIINDNSLYRFRVLNFINPNINSQKNIKIKFLYYHNFFNCYMNIFFKIWYFN